MGLKRETGIEWLLNTRDGKEKHFIGGLPLPRAPGDEKCQNEALCA